MSANGENGAETRPGREVAHRLFAVEFDDSSLSYAESDEERAPNYVISPTGARLNRVFVVGTLTEVTDVNEEMVRARVVDPTGAFVVYAGQYQPEALAFLERADPPTFVAVTGKARTFEPDDGDQVYTSIRPETLATVDADTRDRWVVDTAEHTLDRIGTYAAAADLDVDDEALTEVLLANDVPPGFAEGIPLARSHYGTTSTYLEGLRETALDAVRVVADEQSQVEASVGPLAESTPGEPEMAALAGDTAELTIPSAVEAEPGTDAAQVDDVDAATGAAVGTATASTGAAPSIETADDETDRDPTTSTANADATEAASESDTSESPTSDEAATSGDDATDEEPAVSGDDTTDEIATSANGEELGDFDAGTDDEPDEFEDGMYELDEAEREAVEAEYGTEFTTGTEVDEPGEADIDVPDAEEVVPDETENDDGGDTAADVEEAADESDDVHLQDRVVDAMDELDDGEGAERSAVVETVVDETGADTEAVEQAIQDALMGGECFEPSEGRLQAI